jgi:hypothetical protein
MWFLIVPQEAQSPGGGASLLSSVVNEISRNPAVFNRLTPGYIYESFVS